MAVRGLRTNNIGTPIMFTQGYIKIEKLGIATNILSVPVTLFIDVHCGGFVNQIMDVRIYLE